MYDDVMTGNDYYGTMETLLVRFQWFENIVRFILTLGSENKQMYA